MQEVVFDKPYKFVPPYEGRGWVALFQRILPWYLNRYYGIASVECRGTDSLRDSVQAGDGIVLASNHCRPCDPMVLGSLTPHIGTPLFAMGSWHLFMQSRFTRWMARRAGAFSVYREGMDRQAVHAAIDILEHARRPLIIFPEGVVTRTNDLVTNLLEGASMIASSAARKRAKADPPGRVVVHPIGLKYFFRGDLHAAVEPVLSEIEQRISWRPQRALPLIERIHKLGEALLGLKEIEYFGHTHAGTFAERLPRLIDRLLRPLEEEWLAGSDPDVHIVPRVKRLRSAILPDMISGSITQEERVRRWEHLADMYLAQQLAWYPPDYILQRPTPERILETVERFEEDLTDMARIHRPLHAVIQVADPIEVPAHRHKDAQGDTLLTELRRQIQGILNGLAEESAPLAMPTQTTQFALQHGA